MMNVSIPASAVVVLIRFYKFAISPWLGPTCRFSPSCSSFAIEALQRYGFFRGCWLAFRRVIRCNPWHSGGYDPVP